MKKMAEPMFLLALTTTPLVANNQTQLWWDVPWWVIFGRIIFLMLFFVALISFAGEKKKDEEKNSFRWLLLLPTILLPVNIFYWVVIILAILLIPNYFFWETIRKAVWEPFWWLILLLIILWIPFLRMWWWLFLPIMLMNQLKKLYLWWIGWDYDYQKQKWVLLEITPLSEMSTPLKAMEDVFSSIWPIVDVGNFREVWCDGELNNGPFWCSWEIASIEGKIHFYVRVLEQHRPSIESALYGQYPDIEIKEVPDYVNLVPPTVPNEEWDMYGEDWDYRRENAYPIKTYEKFFEPQGERISDEEKRIDPIISLLEAMSKLGPGEHYWMQFITVPITDYDEPYWRKEGEAIINKTAKRKEKKETTFMNDLTQTLKEIFGGPQKEGDTYSWPVEEDEDTGELRISLTPGEREIISEVENKLKKPVFRTSIRGVYVAKRDAWNSANRIISRGYMGHFNTTNLNSFGFKAETRPKIHFFMRKRRAFVRARKMFRMAVLRFPPCYPNRSKFCPIMSTEELATLYHFPLRVSGMVTPTLEKIESKRGGPPPNLPVVD